MISAVRNLKNTKANSLDGLTSENMKERCSEAVIKDLNMLIRPKDEKQRNGYLANIKKPEENPFQAQSYGPVTLLFVYRQRIRAVLDKGIFCHNMLM